MCNKATYSFTQEIRCTFLPHFWMLRRSRLTLYISWFQRTWNGLLGPHGCDSSLLQIFCGRGRESLLDTSDSCQMGRFNPLFVLHQTRTITTSRESRWKWKCQINVLLQYIICCDGGFDKWDKMTKMFQKQLFLNAFHHVVWLSWNRYHCFHSTK